MLNTDSHMKSLVIGSCKQVVSCNRKVVKSMKLCEVVRSKNLLDIVSNEKL